MKKILLIFFFSIVSMSNHIFFFTTSLLAQVDIAWVKRYNWPTNFDDWATDLAIDASGNVYVTGVSGSGYDSTSQPDYATIKYRPNGDTAWVRRYNGPTGIFDAADAIAVDSSGNVYVTGACDFTGTHSDYATIKYYPNGDTAWVRIYSGPANAWDEGLDIAVDVSGNMYVTGYSTGIGVGYDFATIKYDPTGNELWVKRYNGPGNYNDVPHGMVLDRSGNAYVTGYTTVGPGRALDYVTIKYYPNGDTAWVRRYNGLGNDWDEAFAIAIDDSDNVYVTGGSAGIGSYANYFDYATIKYYANGDTAWVRRYNGPDNSLDESRDITVDGFGNVYVTGGSIGNGTGFDYATIKYYPDGDTAWVRRYNGPRNDEDGSSSIAIDTAGNVYVTGWSYGNGTDRDYTTIQYDPNGAMVWLKRYNGPGNYYDWADEITVDGLGNVYVTGWSVGAGTREDYATIKYVNLLRWDVNNDKKLNVSDVVYLINYLLRNGPAPDPLTSGDASCDDEVNITDVVYLINYFFKGGPAPA
ncbi:MAG: SBBP repeat-containing protein, partial [candidate division Zixibacteria bacterium]|nr:SBBP repeat-containing protein [candidate division Zixibacteria bacterium]